MLHHSAPLPVFTDCNSFLSLMCLLCPVKVENIRLDKSFVVGGISGTFYFSLFAFFPKSNGTFLYSFYLLYKQAAIVKLFSLMLFEAFYLFIGIYGGDATEEKMGHPYCVSYRVYHRSLLQHASIDFIFIYCCF